MRLKFITLLFVSCLSCTNQDSSTNAKQNEATDMITNERPQNWKKVKKSIERTKSQNISNKISELTKNQFKLEEGRDLEVCDGKDNRTLIAIPFALRDRFLQGMRRHFDRLTLTLEALLNNDFKEAERNARGLLMNRLRVSRLAKSGDSGFAVLGSQLHAIDAVSLVEAIQQKDQKKSLNLLVATMKTCNNCHRGYRYTEWPAADKDYKRQPPNTPVPLPKNFSFEKWVNLEE